MIKRLAVLTNILLLNFCIPWLIQPNIYFFSPVPLGVMTGKQYNDRSAYIACLASTSSIQFLMTNSSLGEPYNFHLKFGKACDVDEIYYLDIYVTKIVKSGTSIQELLITVSNSNTPTFFDYYINISISDFESTAIPDPSNNLMILMAFLPLELN